MSWNGVGEEVFVGDMPSVGVAVGVEDTIAVGVEDTVVVGVRVAVGVGVRVAVAVGVEDAVAVGVRVGVGVMAPGGQIKTTSSTRKS